jgi:hypothetical protein
MAEMDLLNMVHLFPQGNVNANADPKAEDMKMLGRPSMPALMTLGTGVSLCAGFSDACVMEPSTRTTAGVRETPRHEIAECGAGRLSAVYGDLVTAWRLRLAESQFSPPFLKGMLASCCL